MLYVILKAVFLFPYLLYRAYIDKKNQPIRLYGIYGYFGLPGKGKTMAMCNELRRLRSVYGDKIYIMTNFCYTDEDFAFTGWKDLLKEYDKPLVVAWDEVQNEFNSRDFKTFPIALLTVLTQVRKKNGIQILYTAQRCPALCHPMDCSPPGSSVHGILQARVLECVAIPFSRDSF